MAGGRGSALDGTDRRAPVVKLGLGLVVAALVFAGLNALANRKATPAAIEAAINASDPNAVRFIQALKATFPNDYRQFLAGAAADANAGMTADQARTMGFVFIQSLIARHQADIAHAPDADLVALVRAQSAALAQLDEKTCARTFMAGIRPTDVVPRAALSAFTDVTVANLRAARHGIDHPVQRPAAVAPGDLPALDAQFAAHGLAPAQADAFTRGTLVAAPAHDQCAGGRTLGGALAALPVAQGGRIMGVLLAGTH